VNVLFVIDRESDQSKLAPLTADALVGDHFAPLVRSDGTRALGETGLLTLTFSEPPTQAELFGQTLAWLRAAPTVKNPGDDAGWAPSLKGAYLNAAWASATETLTRELVGSSEGAPGLMLTLARPPVLRNTLELRVREPLGEEERRALLQADPTRVLNDPNLPGDWVLWKKVVDPGDEDPRRAYMRWTKPPARSASGMDCMVPFRRSGATRSSRSDTSARSRRQRARSTSQATRSRLVPR